MPRTVALVDLGGTLVDFFGNLNSYLVTPMALSSAAHAMRLRGRPVRDQAVLEKEWDAIRRDPSDLKVKPLEERLAALFDIEADEPEVMEEACRAFMDPLYRNARPFEDAIPFLKGLKDLGMTTILVSNTTWGSPAHLWREQLARFGLAPYLDHSVFCRDVGWRKPDRRIFVHALSLAGASPLESIFIGDDPVWDVEGPSSLGIAAVLVDRNVQWVGCGYRRVTALMDIIENGCLE